MLICFFFFFFFFFFKLKDRYETQNNSNFDLTIRFKRLAAVQENEIKKDGRKFSR